MPPTPYKEENTTIKRYRQLLNSSKITSTISHTTVDICSVLFEPSALDFIIRNLHPDISRTQQCLPPNGVRETERSKPFEPMIENIYKLQVCIQRSLYVARVSTMPKITSFIHLQSSSKDPETKGPSRIKYETLSIASVQAIVCINTIKRPEIYKNCPLELHKNLKNKTQRQYSSIKQKIQI